MATTMNLINWLIAVREEFGYISFRNHDYFGNTRTWELPIADIEISLALGL